MRRTSTFRTVAAGCIALGALLMAQAASQDGALPFAQVRADGASAVSAPAGALSQPASPLASDNDVTWGS